jgi:uncharacterized protein (TIGR03067 family)
MRTREVERGSPELDRLAKAPGEVTHRHPGSGPSNRKLGPRRVEVGETIFAAASSRMVDAATCVVFDASSSRSVGSETVVRSRYLIPTACVAFGENTGKETLMRKLTLAVGVAMLAFGGSAAQEKYSELFQKDFDGLQGNWEVTEFVVGGEDRLIKTGEEKQKNSHKNLVNFLRAQTNLPNDERIFSFNLDPTKTPKHIDLLGQVELGKSQRILVRGIYELKDDSLKVCIPILPMGETKTSGVRPTEFKSPKGSNIGLIIMKRSKS